MRTIGAVTGGRCDYGCLLPILRRVEETDGLQLRLWVTGMHLEPEFGLTVREIEADGFAIHDRIDLSLRSDRPEGIAESMGQGVIGFARSFGRSRPDLLLVLGDRFEMAAAALAALPFKIPVAHVHGGEVTQGAMDDALRHAITKLSHLHFAATKESAGRILRMGEEPWRVRVSGAPALDQLRSLPLLSPQELAAKFGLDLKRGLLLVTCHPVTLEYEQTEWQVGELLKALAESGEPVLFTAPNADTCGRIIRRRIEEFVRARPDSASLVPNLGTRAYFSLMKVAAAMVGNSSSGLIEAPSFGLPVVNVGTRQEGRTRAENVIDVGYPREEILAGIRKALSPGFRATLQGCVNPYGDGKASEIIVKALKEIPLDERLIRKRFVDASMPQEENLGVTVAR
ncbi:MAG: UDP-N-acetylglucosamine 2-epimerase (hydrolyzing) [Candidatus Omnitrophica bacterium]|nr:UDP-N-acetylglucosamine 2-epimerase (hydrolyzing) [Candidatus Omnitrophota bacterium]